MWYFKNLLSRRSMLQSVWHNICLFWTHDLKWISFAASRYSRHSSCIVVLSARCCYVNQVGCFETFWDNIVLGERRMKCLQFNCMKPILLSWTTSIVMEKLLCDSTEGSRFNLIHGQTNNFEFISNANKFPNLLTNISHNPSDCSKNVRVASIYGSIFTFPRSKSFQTLILMDISDPERPHQIFPATF